MVQHGFFNRNTFDNATALNDQVVKDFGGNGDCGFLSIAGSFLFNLYMNNNLYNKTTVQKIMDNFYIYYPDFKPSQNIDAQNHLIALLNHQSNEHLIAMFAYIFRQISVDELCQNPEIYRGAFSSENEGTSPENMRKSGTWIDESSIAALANALDLTIKVIDKGNGKLVGKSYVYNQAAKNQITIQLQSGHYKGVLKSSSEDVDNFIDNKAGYTPPLLKPAKVIHKDPSEAEIIAKCNAYDKKVLSDFNQIKENLNFKVKIGDLNTEKLIQMYIAAINNSDYLQGRHIASIRDSGNENFFRTIVEAQRAAKEGITVTYPQENQMDSINHELIHAISRAVSIDHANLEELFQHVEDSPTNVKNTMRSTLTNSFISGQNKNDSLVADVTTPAIRGN